MTDSPMPAGWYQADGDPAGTQRYWNGTTWQGGPQATAAGAGAGTAATAGGPNWADAQAPALIQSDYGPLQWAMEPFKKYADFKGRARRAEYWWFNLGLAVIVLVLGIFASLFNSAAGLIPLGLFFLATIIPSLAVTIRRLHDSGKSGWYYLLTLVPLISLIVLVFMFLDSDKGPNEWGPSPKYG